MSQMRNLYTRLKTANHPNCIPHNKPQFWVHVELNFSLLALNYFNEFSIRKRNLHGNLITYTEYRAGLEIML